LGVKAWFPGAKPLEKIYLFLATGLGSGFSPFASGTAGSAVAVVLYLAFHRILSPEHPWMGLLFLFAATALSVACADAAEKYYRKKDDGRVVIDEFVGQWIALYLIPLNYWTPVAAFFLFRVFDVVKPFPAGRSQKLPGGVGITIDDAIAGIYSNLVLQAILWWI